MESARLVRRGSVRNFSGQLLGALALLAACCSAPAQESWPSRPIKLVVPLTAGGGATRAVIFAVREAGSRPGRLNAVNI